MTAEINKAVDRLTEFVTARPGVLHFGPYGSAHYGEWISMILSELTRLREENATLSRERDEARGLWEWLASRRNLELSYGVIDDPSEAFWLVHSVNGGINDREWTLVGTGSTPLEALSLARQSKEGGEQ